MVVLRFFEIIYFSLWLNQFGALLSWLFLIIAVLLIYISLKKALNMDHMAQDLQISDTSKFNHPYIFLVCSIFMFVVGFSGLFVRGQLYLPYLHSNRDELTTASESQFESQLVESHLLRQMGSSPMGWEHDQYENLENFSVSLVIGNPH